MHVAVQGEVVQGGLPASGDAAHVGGADDRHDRARRRHRLVPPVALRHGGHLCAAQEPAVDLGSISEGARNRFPIHLERMQVSSYEASAWRWLTSTARCRHRARNLSDQVNTAAHAAAWQSVNRKTTLQPSI